MKRNVFLRLLCALGLAAALAACGSGSNSFTWFVDAVPVNLDPQVACSSEDVTACRNLYTTLMRQNAAGELVYGCAAACTVSADGLCYTFTLQEGLPYLGRRGTATEYKVTAEDFVFAFRRIYAKETASPYTGTFSAIENSAEVLAGEAAPVQLGVAAKDANTVVFTLSRRDDAFLQKLALPGAAPCNQAFFESTKGTYGLTMNATVASGAFYLQNWTDSGLFLRRAGGGDRVDSLRLVTDSENTQTGLERLQAGRCTAALDDSFAPVAMTAVEYTDTTWCLVFQQGNGVLADAGLRSALAAVAMRAELPFAQDARYRQVRGLVPEDAALEGKNYRESAGNLLPQLADAWESYTAALERVPLRGLNSCTLLVPESMAEAGQILNGCWQKEFSLFLSMETVPDAELHSRLSSGHYTIALVPVRLPQADPLSLLEQFAGGFTGYSSPEYAALCDMARRQGGNSRLAFCAEAEAMVLRDCTAVPLFGQNRRLLVAQGVDGLCFDPFGPVLDLTEATKIG